MPAQTITYPLVALTLMLWLIWSDSVRPQRPSRIVYAIRALLFLGVGGLVVYRMVETPGMYSATARVLVVLTGLVGVGGCAYFLRKASGRRPRLS